MNFSVGNFKKWMDNHKEQHFLEKPKYNGPVGTFVESKIELDRLILKIVSEEDNVKKLAEDFLENGGKISEVNGLDFLIEVASGTFYIKRVYCKKIN